MNDEFPSHEPGCESDAPNLTEPSPGDTPFSLFAQLPPPLPKPERLPNLLHLLILGIVFSAATLLTGLGAALALHFHLWGISNQSVFTDNIRYALALQLIIYLLTLAGSFILLPMLWRKPFFPTISWRADALPRRMPMLVSSVLLCYTLAIVSTLIFHESDAKAPIEQAFMQQGAPWMLFLFGVTMAPLFEELVFRGFTLPALASSYDWCREKLLHLTPPQNNDDGTPCWTKPALLFASLLTSLAFALIHAPQTAGSKESFALLFSVSLVLCLVRLRTRSLAASTLVHALYNFILFTMMLIYTHGFQQMDKLQ